MYPSDLTASKWQLIEKIQKDKRKRKHSLRSSWNAIFFVLKSGCQWRMLPSDFPKWQTVYYHFRQWKLCGLFEEVHDTLYQLFFIHKWVIN